MKEAGGGLLQLALRRSRPSLFDRAEGIGAAGHLVEQQAVRMYMGGLSSAVPTPSRIEFPVISTVISRRARLRQMRTTSSGRSRNANNRR
jgi:hypothetical protein